MQTTQITAFLGRHGGRPLQRIPHHQGGGRYAYRGASHLGHGWEQTGCPLYSGREQNADISLNGRQARLPRGSAVEMNMDGGKFEGRSVLVTGASSGIGAALARHFAAQGARVALVARRRERLEALAAQIAQAGQPEPVVIEADLCADGACAQVVEQATTALGPIEVLVNNAGVGYAGAFANLEPKHIEQMLGLNIRALVRLTHLVLPAMLQRRQGWIMNVASVVGHVPFACMPVYAPSKSFVVAFTDALWAQTRGTGVSVTSLAPGTTRTEFFDHREWTGIREMIMKMSMSPERVARIGIRALSRGRRSAVCGWRNALFVLLMKVFPRRWLAQISAKLGA